MNNFFQEVWEICNLPVNEVLKQFKTIQIGSKTIYISNFNRIVDYTDKHLILKVKNQYYEVSGDSLEIKLINKGEIVVTGNISATKLGE